MKFYTLCIDEKPIFVLSQVSEPSIPDEVWKDPELAEAIRANVAYFAELEAIAPGCTQTCEWDDPNKVDEALATWLGDDLKKRFLDGEPLWDGDANRIHVRNATPEEEDQWQRSCSNAEAAGHKEAGPDKNWLAFLVPTTGGDDPFRRFLDLLSVTHQAPTRLQ